LSVVLDNILLTIL